MILPKSLQHEAISLDHEGSHPGQDAIKRRLRAHFWFPGMDNVIKLQVKKCHECQITTATPIKAPLTSTPFPDKPRQTYKLTCSAPYQTKGIYWWYAATSVNFQMQKFFAQPEPNMSSQHSEKYTRSLATLNVINATMDHHSMDWSIKWGIKIKASYPYHPQRNEAECFMKPLKRAIQIRLEKRC